MSISPYTAWIGRERTRHDVLDPSAATRLWRTFDSEATARVGDLLPEGWQWLYFLPDARQSELGPDGHEKRGGFFPPIAAPRRMFAGGSARYHGRLVLGVEAALTERIGDVALKQGRSGPLWFVRLERRITQNGELVVEEEQDIVYREPAAARGEPRSAGRKAELSAEWRRNVLATSTLLMRFSALTFNTHRIHYDRDYARTEEGYPGLVVHGPLIALLLLEEARQRCDGRAFESFTFRSMQPVFEDVPFWLCGVRNGAAFKLWAELEDGSIAMSAEATLAP